MRPRIYFVLGSILLGLGLAGTVACSAFFINLILFTFKTHHPFVFLILGRHGLRPFLLTFPWLPFLVAFLGIWGGSRLLKKYDISYKKNFWGLVIVLLIAILVLGFLIHRSNINPRLGKIRPLRGFYQSQLPEEEKQMFREKIRQLQPSPPFSERGRPPFLYK